MAGGSAKWAVLVLAVLLLAGCTEVSKRRVRLEPTITRGQDQGERPPVAVGSRPVEPPRTYKVTGSIGFYRVAKTDTLISIAKRFYGNARFARELGNVNSQRIDEAGGLKRGLVLVLPKIEEEDRSLPLDTRP